MTDHHFPRFHLRPANGFVNDPNGPVYIGGRLHLYYQYCPATSHDCPVSWGHASSEDTVSWVHHRAAMTPSPAGLDRDGVWSGNTIAAGGDVIAFYSGYRRTHQYQSVLAARSRDGGFSFGDGEAAVADPRSDEGIITFRDPFVWQEDDRWRLVVGAGDEHGTASVRLYESTDLRNWGYLGPLLTRDRTWEPPWDAGTMWECPQVITFGTQIAVLVSAWSTEGIAGVLAISGHSAGAGLTDPTVSRYDAGSNFYAACVLRESEVGAVVWGWATEGRTKEWAEEADWSGMVSLPRVVRLAADGTIASVPVPAMSGLRAGAISPCHADDRAGRALAFDQLPAQLEILISFAASPERTTSSARLRFSPDEYMDLIINWQSGVITIDREHASSDDRAHGRSVSFDEPFAAPDRDLTVRLFLDGSIVELFTLSGKCATTRIYPIAPPPWSLDVAGLASHDRVEVWSLRASLPDLRDCQDPM